MFSVEPSTVDVGEQARLQWSVRGASKVELDQGIGEVAPIGSRHITAQESISFNLTATSAGGNNSAVVRLRVLSARPSIAPDFTGAGGESGEESELKDIFFEFGKSELTGEAVTSLTRTAKNLETIIMPSAPTEIVVEGHCDERGSAEYNLALADERANTVKQFLSAHAIPASRIRIMSYGEERPVCWDSTERCWQMNRRVHFEINEGGR